ncbi:MAG: peptidylprolyl isomerase [Gemmatimonadaceae bacterium]|nr:peptidylprolyl isomerase [Gemmatimonadaceae bacterium]
MLRTLVVAGLLAVLAAPVAAQDGLRLVDVDRVVAVVASKPILMSEVLERVNLARAQGLQVPRDSAGQMAVARQILGQLVDEEVLIAVANEYKLTVPEQDVSAQVDQGVQRVRAQFASETEYREALRREGFGTPEEYRRRSIEQAQRDQLQTKALDTLRALGRLAPVNVTEREVQEAFDRFKSQLGTRPAMVSFRQIVTTAKPSEANRERARQLADSLRQALNAGADFDSVARAYSADGSASIGGDLGWKRRGDLVVEFEQMIFALVPGRISPVVETVYGFHVIRVDRVRPGEVRSRHVLITPKMEPADGEKAKARADTVLTLWRSGTPYDTLVARYHDMNEERVIPDGIPVDSLPVEYRLALRDKPSGAFTEVFGLPDPGTGLRKFAVAQVMEAKPAGEWTLDEYQERVRRQLKEEKSTRRTLDILRREYYVDIRL